MEGGIDESNALLKEKLDSWQLSQPEYCINDQRLGEKCPGTRPTIELSRKQMTVCVELSLLECNIQITCVHECLDSTCLFDARINKVILFCSTVTVGFILFVG